MTILKSEPVIKVGIVSAPKIVFVLNGDFLLNNEIIVHSGNYNCSFEQVLEKDFTYSPLSANATFTLLNVKIGIGFHWEQHEDQTFEGELFITKENNLVIAINQVSLEKYLESVISSEMSAMNDLNLLNTHAIVSRSWLLAQLFNKKNDETKFIKTKEETLKWYDREDHSLFDVCADDHCQRYQGITKVISTNAIQAIQETRGLVLCHNDSICDARFSKCCGGISEDFGNAWQPIYIPYLTSVIDSEEGTPMPDISSEQYYTTSPQAYCNTKDTEVLSQILIDFDRDTPDFYRWIVPYSQKTLSELLHKNQGSILGK
jgi:stage II sporulation protein D